MSFWYFSAAASHVLMAAFCVSITAFCWTSAVSLVWISCRWSSTLSSRPV